MLEEFPNEKVNYETQDIKQGLTDYDWLVQSLEKHAERLQNSEYESPGVAELISRSFIAITEGCNNYSSQKNINQTIAAVLADLAQCIDQGELEIPIARVYPLAAVREAYRELEQRHTHG
ncbi:MAG TPA: zinc-binding dehydrogenase, partial [Ktedonobacteraceae bacterium]|nr:zinc-binding dehydrogenase [Ktedonobacteraceae bacterium]